MEIGKRIYYEILTGNILVDTGERRGSVLEKTVEQDIEIYKVLSERNRDTFDVIELEYGQYRQDFVESKGYRVNPETKTLEFSDPDPNEPEAPPVFVKPLTEQISDLEAKTDQAVMELTMIIAMGGMG